MKTKVILTAIFAILAIGFFAYAIYSAIHFTSIGKPGDMPNILNHVIIVVGGVLATNLGAVLGIQVDQGGGFSLGFRKISTDPSIGIREICAFLYAIALIIALIFWGISGFTEKSTEIVDSIPMLSKTLIGVAVGALTVVLK